MIAFHLITGFLGSGKTSLLSHLLTELTSSQRIAVIQNEFAPSGIDGKILKQHHNQFHLMEMNNGSVFCVCQLSNFIQNLQKLIDNYQPDSIFLEASGLADPISVVELLQNSELKNKVSLDNIFTLIDAENFFKGLHTIERFKHQIMIADHLIINKIDLCQPGLEPIQQELRRLNPYAEMTCTRFAKVDWADLTAHQQNHRLAAQRYVGMQSEGRPNIKAVVLRTHEKISEKQLKDFIGELTNICPRIKAFMNLNDGSVVAVHTVFEQIEIKALSTYSGPSELIAFGNNLTIGSLNQLFKKSSRSE